MEVAVVGGEDDEGVVQLALAPDLLQDGGAGRVDLRRHPVVVPHHVLPLVVRIVPPPPSRPALVVVRKEARQTGPVRVVVFWVRDVVIAIEPHGLVLRQILPLVAIDRVGREEGHVDKERLVARPPVQKLEGVGLVLLGDVPHPPPAHIVVPPILLDLKVRPVLVLVIESPLANVAGVIAVGLEEVVHGLIPRQEEVLGLGAVVSGQILGRHHADPAGPAHRRGDAVLGEPDPLGCQPVQRGSLY